jgi:hypothetical protein
MPVVPRRRQAAVPTAPLPVVRPPAGAFMPPEQINFGPAVRTVGEIIEQRQDEVDQLEVIESDAKLAAATNELLYNPEKGALTRRGKDALQGQIDAEGAWRKTVSEIEAGLKNDRQRLAFKRTVASREEDFNRSLLRHVDTEFNAYGKATTDAHIANEYGLILKNYDDLPRVQEGIDRIRAVITLDARRTGEPREVTQQRIGAVQSRAHTAVIDRMLAETGGHTRAKDYYERIKESVFPEDAVRVEKALRAGTVLGEAQSHADSIISARDVTRTDAFEQARKITDPEIRHETEQRLDTEFRRRDAAERDSSEARFKLASDITERGGRPAPSVWSALSLDQRQALEQRRKQLAGGKDASTDWKLYYDLKIMAASPDRRGEFLAENLLEYRHRLGESEFKELVNAKGDLLKGRPNEELTGYLTVASKVDGAIKDAKINPDSDRGRDLRRAVDREVLSYKQSTGKTAVPPSDLDKIIDTVVMKKVFISERGFDAQRRVGLVSEDERGRAYAKDIPEAERNDLANRMRKAGTRVTDSKVARAYAQLLLGDADAALQIIAEP